MLGDQDVPVSDAEAPALPERNRPTVGVPDSVLFRLRPAHQQLRPATECAGKVAPAAGVRARGVAAHAGGVPGGGFEEAVNTEVGEVFF